MLKVSVVIPTYNRASFLKEAVDSVLAQTYVIDELIIIDDGSTDNTEETIKDYTDKRIKYFKHEKNKGNIGGSIARNTGIKLATGEFIAFLDDDDLWQPQKIEKQLALFDKAPARVAAVYTGYYVINDQKNIVGLINPKDSYSSFNKLITRNWIGTTSTVMVRATVLAKIGLFDETLPACQDWDLWIRIARKYTILPLKEPLVKLRVHTKGSQKKRITENYQNLIKGREALYLKIKKDLVKSSPATRAEYYFEEGRFNAYHMLMNKARSCYLASLHIKPSVRSVLRLIISLIPPHLYSLFVFYKRKLYQKWQYLRYKQQ